MGLMIHALVPSPMTIVFMPAISAGIPASSIPSMETSTRNIFPLL